MTNLITLLKNLFNSDIEQLTSFTTCDHDTFAPITRTIRIEAKTSDLDKLSRNL